MTKGQLVSMVAITSIATFLSNLSAGIINVPLPQITRALHADNLGLVYIVLAYVVPYAVIMPAIGKLGDAYGHKRVFVWGMGLYTAASLLAGFSPNVATLVVLRLLQGLGGGIILVSVVFISAQIREGAGLALGVWRGALLAGTVAGPVVGGYLATFWGWPSVFWATAPIGALAWLWAAQALTELPIAAGRRFDWIGALAFVVAFSALVVALSVTGMDTMQAGLRGALGRTMGAMALMLYGTFVVSLVVLWINQKTEKQPLFDASLYRIRPFVLGNIGTWLVCVGMFSAMMFVPLGLQYVGGYSALQASNALLPLTITAILVGIWGGRLTDRLGPIIPWAFGFAILAVSFAALAALGPRISPVWLFSMMTLAGTGMALPLAPTAVAALTTVPEKSAGEASGLFNFAHNMGRAIALGAFGAILVLTDASSYSLIFWISAVAMVVAAGLALGLRQPSAAQIRGGQIT